MKKLLFLPLVLLTLPAAMCETRDPGIEIRTVEVIKEVQKPCPGTAPARPGPLGALPATAEAALATVLAKLGEYSGDGQYADQAEAYFETCPSVKE